jgi:pyruvate kinase
MGPEKVPLAQKQIIRKTNDAGKPVITATQMLDSMIRHARPTRAEASDVANAVLDGTDALMLSGETAVGEHPVGAVSTMSRIISEIESSEEYRHSIVDPQLDLQVSTLAIANAAVIASEQMRCATIAVVSNSGGATRLISEYRPTAPIAAFTSDETTYRRLALHWGVTPILMDPAVSLDELVERVEAALSSHDLAKSGDNVVLTASVPVGAGEATNILKVHRMP